MSRRFATVTAALAAGVLGLGGCGGGDDAGTMILATTTSTRDSGLLDVLIPDFERGSDCRVKTLAVGSGQALELGERGDADVLLVHSPAAEQAFMREGHGTGRLAVMHNDFVLVGPPSDPARLAGAANAPAAMRRIARARAPFASRGDASGTHAKELALWETAGIRPRGAWYVETGQGMGETLTIAGQKQAYTLSDRGTFLATEALDAKLLVEGGAAMSNPYHVITVRHEGTNTGCARAFSSWIRSPVTQRTISRFGVSEFGEPLFFGDVRR
jgi:tungstate transport system substrate-binding protein